MLADLANSLVHNVPRFRSISYILQRKTLKVNKNIKMGIDKLSTRVYSILNERNKNHNEVSHRKEQKTMAMYRLDYEDDNFNIIDADSNKEAIHEALESEKLVFNVTLLDENYDEVEVIY